MRPVLRVVVCVLAGAVSGVIPAAAQSEQQLRQAFEGRYVAVRIEMPATHRGVDLHPAREPAVDFRGYSARLREFGVALREGDRVLVTAVRVKKKNIEFHLGGGGYGVWGDDTGSVYVPTVSKSGREKDLEKEVKRERDPERRRRLQRELDHLRRDREREERDRDQEKRELEAHKQTEIADKRLGAGSRVNVWLPEAQLASAVPTPAELRRLLSPVIAFVDDDGPRMTGDRQGTELAEKAMGADRADRADRNGEADRRADASRRVEAGRAADLRRGMTVDDVHDLLGAPKRTKSGKQGDLATLTEWYEDRDRVTEVVYVAAVVVRFSTTSK